MSFKFKGYFYFTGIDNSKSVKVGFESHPGVTLLGYYKTVPDYGADLIEYLKYLNAIN